MRSSLSNYLQSFVTKVDHNVECPSNTIVDCLKRSFPPQQSSKNGTVSVEEMALKSVKDRLFEPCVIRSLAVVFEKAEGVQLHAKHDVFR